MVTRRPPAPSQKLLSHAPPPCTTGPQRRGTMRRLLTRLNLDESHPPRLPTLVEDALPQIERTRLRATTRALLPTRVRAGAVKAVLVLVGAFATQHASSMVTVATILTSTAHISCKAQHHLQRRPLRAKLKTAAHRAQPRTHTLYRLRGTGSHRPNTSLYRHRLLITPDQLDLPLIQRPREPT